MTSFHLPAAFGEQLAIVLVALAADLLLAGLPVVATVLGVPRALFEAVSGWFDRRLNRAHRSPVVLRMRGAVVAVAVLALAAFLGYGIHRFNRDFSYGWAVEIALAAALFGQKRIISAVLRVRAALKAGRTPAAAAALAPIVGHDTAGLDEHAIVRGAVERSAMAVSDSVVAPILFYLLFGLPGMFVYRAASVLAARSGNPAPPGAPYGTAAVALESLFNVVPGPAAALLLVCGTLVVPGANPLRAVAGAARGGFSHARPGTGWPVGAVAGALDLALMGPRKFEGVGVKAPWLGSGRARATAVEITRALYLQLVATFLAAAALAALAVFWAGEI